MSALHSSHVLFKDVFLFDLTSESGLKGPTDLLVVDGAIAAIGPSELSETSGRTRVIEGHSDHLLIPGLINAHFHSPANHLKGSLRSLPLELFMLYESPPDPDLMPTPREAYLRTMLGAIEMLKTGTTSVQDDAFLMPYPTTEIIDAVMQAYADSGLRATVALDQPSLPDEDKIPYAELFDDSARAILSRPPAVAEDELLDAYRHLFTEWHLAFGGRLRAALSISAPQRVSIDYFSALDDMSRQHSVPIFAHMLETKVQRALAGEHSRFAGRSLVEYVADHDLLSDRMNVIHAVWVSDNDLRLIADAGSIVVHNPVSNLRLGSGIAPFRKIKNAGITLALGTDEAICDDSVNVWSVVKTAGLIHNVSGIDFSEWPTAGEVLESLWRGGSAATLQADRLGDIRVGNLADLTMIDLQSIAFTPLNDVRGQLVYCESGGSVRLTMVDGSVIYDHGVFTNIDEHALLAEAREVFAGGQLKRNNARRSAEALVPGYSAVIRAAAEAPLGMNRWLATT